MSARIYAFPDRQRITVEEAVAHWQERAAGARKVAVLLRQQLDAALAEVARCEALARLAAEKIPPCPASATTDSERSSLPRKDPHP